MTLSKTGIAAAMLATLVLAGCQSQRFASMDTRSSTVAQPLEPAPSGQVSSGQQLPPPSGPDSNDPSAFPEPPSTGEQSMQDQQMASASAPDLTKSSLVGSWSVNSAGASCQMFLTLTKYGNASRGGTRGCGGDLTAMRGWDVVGKQLVLYDDSGTTIASLYSSGNERLNGQTSSGFPVTLSR